MCVYVCVSIIPWKNKPNACSESPVKMYVRMLPLLDKLPTISAAFFARVIILLCI